MKKRPGAKAPDLWRFVVGLKPYAKPKYDDEDKDNNDDYNSGSLRDDKQKDKQRQRQEQMRGSFTAFRMTT